MVHNITVYYLVSQCVAPATVWSIGVADYWLSTGGQWRTCTAEGRADHGCALCHLGHPNVLAVVAPLPLRHLGCVAVVELHLLLELLQRRAPSSEATAID